MRIAIDVSQSIYGTGVADYTRNLVVQLTRLETDHEWVLFGGSLRRKEELDRFIKRVPHAIGKTYYLSPNVLNILWNSFHLLPVERLIGKTDLVHTSDWAEPPAKAPKVTTVHDLNFYHDPNFALPSIRKVQYKRLYWVAKEAKTIIAVSQATKADIVKYLDIDPERITVIYEAGMISSMPTPDEAIIESFKRKKQITRPFLFVPGAGHPRKNIKNIIEAFSLLHSDMQLVISGRASLDEKAAATENVVFTDFATDAEMEILYSQAQACVYTSYYEGFGIPILNAFACQIPVITSKTSSMPEVAGNAAILVEPSSPEEIKEGIIKALDNRHELVIKGSERLTQFSWEKTAQQTLRTYEHTIQTLK